MKDRAAMDAVIRRSQVCRLGLVDGDVAYVVPMSFGYDGEYLYFHCAPEGRKVDLLRRNPRVGFEFDLVEGLVEAETACRWGVRYQSVIGTGTAEFLEDPAAKRRALEAVMAQYSPRSFSFAEETLGKTAVLRVLVETLTGKRSPA